MHVPLSHVFTPDFTYLMTNWLPAWLTYLINYLPIHSLIYSLTFFNYIFNYLITHSLTHLLIYLLKKILPVTFDPSKLFFVKFHPNSNKITWRTSESYSLFLGFFSWDTKNQQYIKLVCMTLIQSKRNLLMILNQFEKKLQSGKIFLSKLE